MQPNYQDINLLEKCKAPDFTAEQLTSQMEQKTLPLWIKAKTSCLDLLRVTLKSINLFDID